jgi:hypothetical protein
MPEGSKFHQGGVDLSCYFHCTARIDSFGLVAGKLCNIQPSRMETLEKVMSIIAFVNIQ